MNKMMTKAALLAAAFIVSLPLGLMAQQDEGYYPYSYARLSYVNGAVYVQRTSDQGYEKGEVNLALVQGDKIGTEIGQAEIQLGRRNYLRLGDNTKVEFALLPTSGDERFNVHLTEGSAYLRVSVLATDKGIEIHTPDASFYVLEEGLYRFDVRPEGSTQVFVREGSLEAAAEEGSVVVRAQETVSASNGRLLGQPEYGSPRNDAFDEWNGSRDDLLAARSGSQYLPSDMEEYEEELDQNGHWVYERPYGNVWVPDVSYYDDWRPYYYGRWSWYPVIGWTWISSEPWGWPVYHYGRWNWRFGLGWYWIPRSHWGPAWVHWWWDRDYIGWCPLTWYNRPGYLFNDRFYDRFDDRWFSAHNRAMTVVRRDHLQSPDVGRRHLGSADLDRIGRVELRAQQPGIRPAVDRGGPQAVAARRVLADRGVRSQVRNVAPSRSVVSSRLRPGSVDQGLRSRDRGDARPSGSRESLARPSIRNDASAGRAIRTYPSGRSSVGRDQSGVPGSRRSVEASPSRRNDSAVGSRSREPRTIRSQGQDRGSVKSYPPTTRGTVRSGSDRSSSSSYSSRSAASRPSSRLSSPSVSSARPSPSISRPNSSSRSSSSRSSRTPSYSQSRPSYSSPSRSGSSSRSYASPRSSYSSPSRSGSSSRSYTSPRSSYSSPSRSSGSSGRSFSSPRSSRSSSGRSFSSPRSSGSSGRSSGSVRSSGSSRSGGSSGRSGSSGRTSSSKSSSSSRSSASRKR